MSAKHLLRAVVGVLALLSFNACIADSPLEESTEQHAETPPAPTGLVANVVAPYQVNLSWDPVPNADFYVIMKGTAPGNETTYTSSTPASPTFTDDHLSPGTQYSFQVKVVVLGGTSGPSNEVVFTTPGAPAGIAPPATVSATAISTSRIEVSWSAVPNAVKYYIFQSQAGGPFSYVSSVVAPGTTYTATGLAAGTMYSYQIQAVDAADLASASSATASATTFGAAMQLPAPTGVTATAISSSRINVTWTAVPNAVKYYVFQSQAGGPMTYVSSVVTPGTSYLATGLLPGTLYSYEIQAVDAADVAGPSSSPPASATTLVDSSLPAPTGVTATAISTSRITVSWTAVTNAVKYYVYQSEGGGPSTYVSTVVAPSTSYLATNLMAGTSYGYVIQAVDAADLGGALSSPPAFATTFITGLGSRWKFDDQTGSTAVDSSGAGRTGTLQGGATFGTANKPPFYDEDLHNPSYLSVPGGSGDFVSVADAGLFDFTGDFAVSLWAKVPTAPSGTVHLIGMRAAGCGAVQWELAQDAANGLHFAGGGGVVSFGQSLTPGTWTQLVVSNSGGTLSLYVGGSQVATGAYTVGADQGVALQIGNAGSCGNGGALFLDEVRVYETALTPMQAAALGTPPPAPATLTGQVISSTQVDLQWSAVAGADLYILYRGTASGNQVHYTSLSSTTLSWQEGHLTAGETSSWYVVAVVDGLRSAPSPEVVITTSGALGAPTGLTATLNPNASNRVELSWTASAGAAKYYLFRSVNGGAFTYLTTVVSPGTSFSDANLAAGTYSYQIQSEDAGYTTSAMSAPVSITTM